MFGLLFSLASWFQPEISSGSAPVAGAAPVSARGVGFFGQGLESFGIMALMFVGLYFVMIRPQQKKQKETDALLKALKKGQRVRTTGGIRGEIVDFKEENGDEVVLMISDRVKINVLRSHVAGLVEQREEAQKS